MRTTIWFKFVDVLVWKYLSAHFGLLAGDSLLSSLCYTYVCIYKALYSTNLHQLFHLNIYKAPVYDVALILDVFKIIILNKWVGNKIAKNSITLWVSI